jgi:type III secretion system FlhB-like substrate exporter
MMGANLAVKHHLLPTKADEARGKGKTAKQIIAKAKRDAMKGEGVENPLNDKTDE